MKWGVWNERVMWLCYQGEGFTAAEGGAVTEDGAQYIFDVALLLQMRKEKKAIGVGDKNHECQNEAQCIPG